jgi:hypothetical protein
MLCVVSWEEQGMAAGAVVRHRALGSRTRDSLEDFM